MDCWYPLTPSQTLELFLGVKISVKFCTVNKPYYL